MVFFFFFFFCILFPKGDKYYFNENLLSAPFLGVQYFKCQTAITKIKLSLTQIYKKKDDSTKRLTHDSWEAVPKTVIRLDYDVQKDKTRLLKIKQDNHRYKIINSVTQCLPESEKQYKASTKEL